MCFVIRDQGIVECVSNRFRRLGSRYVTLRKPLSYSSFSFPILQRKNLGQMAFKIALGSKMISTNHYFLLFLLTQKVDGWWGRWNEELNGCLKWPDPLALPLSSQGRSLMNTVLWVKALLTQAPSPLPIHELYCSAARASSLSGVTLLQGFYSHLNINFHILKWKAELKLLRKLVK